MNLFDRMAWAAPTLMLVTSLSGCGTPGAPQPPSLNLPDTVTDLAATRTGNQVTLTWKMPRRNTDKTILKAGVTARICRREGEGACFTAGVDQSVVAGGSVTYTDTLAGPLASGKPRPVSYFVELLNKKNKSAGLSNAATVVLGAAPGAVEGLKAEVRRQGVVLSWAPDSEIAAVRLERKLVTPPPARSQSQSQPKSEQGPLAPAPEPINQSLLVETGAEQGRAIDSTAHFDETYEYRAQRVIRIDVNGKVLELPGEVSAPVSVDVKDVFPPSVPTSLVAVASAGSDGRGPSIDLNWQPDTDADLAGYIVYRRENGGEWQRVSPAAPAIEPAFHDLQVQPGHTYRYAVSAVGKSGHESERSAEADETVPQP
jgi:hypothetical protein